VKGMLNDLRQPRLRIVAAVAPVLAKEVTMFSKELKEQIWSLVLEQVNWCREHPSHIACGAEFFGKLEPLIKQAGYVKLADDQSLPEIPCFVFRVSKGGRQTEDSVLQSERCLETQRDMLKAGFRKVVEANVS